jgi:hypothetical protein
MFDMRRREFITLTPAARPESARGIPGEFGPAKKIGQDVSGTSAWASLGVAAERLPMRESPGEGPTSRGLGRRRMLSLRAENLRHPTRPIVARRWPDEFA